MASMEHFGAPDNAIRAHLLGFLFQGLSMFLNLGALSLMAESSVTIVNSFAVVSIIAVSWWLLGEKPAVQSVIGAFVVFLGMSLCVMSKPEKSAVLSFDQSIRFLQRPQDIVWISVIPSVSIVIFFVGLRFNFYPMLPFGGGLMGGISETLAKFLSVSFLHPNTLVVFLSILAVTVSIELYMIKTSLVYLKPHNHQLLFFVSWSIIGILSGGIMFDEFVLYAGKTDRIFILCFGLLSIVLGASIPSLMNKRRRHASRVFRASHKAVPEVIASLIRPPLVYISAEKRPEYGLSSEDDEVDSDHGAVHIEMQSLIKVGSDDRGLDQSAGQPNASYAPKQLPRRILSDDSDE